MRSYKDHLIFENNTIKQALNRLNELAKDAILFAIDENGKLVGSLTDGDVRRGLLSGKSIEDSVNAFIQPHPKYIDKENYSLKDIIAFREKLITILPVVDKANKIINVVNFGYAKSYLPVDAVIMAGGRGSRLQPLTDTTPKPLLKVGDKPIIEHNIDRLAKFGIDDLWLSVRYLGEQLENYFGDGTKRNLSIKYIWEDEPLGTIGAVSKVQHFKHDYVLVTNSDILTNLDYEDFFLDFIEKDADMSVITIPYAVNVPYAVMETANNHVLSFKEKPTYTYYSNGGIYLIKREILELIPENTFYNSTDLMQQLIQDDKRLISFPIRQYWLDIGKHEDYIKAQEDVKYLDL